MVGAPVVVPDGYLRRELGTDYKLSEDCAFVSMNPLVYRCDDFCGPGRTWRVGDARCAVNGIDCSPYDTGAYWCRVEGEDCMEPTDCGELYGWVGQESKADICGFYCTQGIVAENNGSSPNGSAATSITQQWAVWMLFALFLLTL